MYDVFVTSGFYTGIYSVNEWRICFSKANSNDSQGKHLTHLQITGLYLQCTYSSSDSFMFFYLDLGQQYIYITAVIC